MRAHIATLSTCALLGVFALGCDSEPAPTLAPQASSLAPAKAKTPEAMAFSVNEKGSKIEFEMAAPEEKIRGRVSDATTGELQIDLTDITKTTAHIQVDISGIELFQRRAAEDGTFGEETKSDDQNKHARTWLQISDDAPEEERKKNANVEFVIKEVTADTKDVTKLTGNERKVTFSVKGDFLLHGRKTEKTAKLEATFHYDGDKPKSVTIKTVEPFGVGLAEHDVKPREAFGKLAQKTLDVLAPKVAKEAMVSIELNADLSGAGDTKPASSSPKPADSAKAY